VEPGAIREFRWRRQARTASVVQRKGKGFWPYGERFGGREDERGSDSEERPASRERNVDYSSPPVHGRGGGEVAGAGGGEEVEAEGRW